MCAQFPFKIMTNINEEEWFFIISQLRNTAVDDTCRHYSIDLAGSTRQR